MHVVVGKYVGDSLDLKKPDLTFDEINGNRFHPDPDAGKNGEPVFLNPGEQHKAKRLYHINKFNIVASDKIPLNRSLADIRKPKCRVKVNLVII